MLDRWYYDNFKDKMFYFRQHHKDREKVDNYVEKIVKGFGYKIFNRSSVFFDDSEWALKWAMEHKKIKVAVEIGTWHGLATAIMSKYAEKVITLEIDVKDMTNPNIKHEVWKELGITNIEPMMISCEGQKEKILSNIDFDFCYMDGGHANYTYSDWMMVRKCGRVLFHEYWEKQPPVRDLVNSLPKEEVSIFTVPHYALWVKNGK